jgi:hypothetical protein
MNATREYVVSLPACVLHCRCLPNVVQGVAAVVAAVAVAVSQSGQRRFSKGKKAAAVAVPSAAAVSAGQLVGCQGGRHARVECAMRGLI